MLGYTWYAKSACKTAVNTETKFLLLQYIFEQKAAIAVEFRTHYFNHTSRSAIERLGAKQDGVLRSHQIMRDGSIRDTVVYSILQHEWPAVKNNLLSKLSLNDDMGPSWGGCLPTVVKARTQLSSVDQR